MPHPTESVNTIPPATTETLTPSLVGRCGIGGVLMGLANLVPGISGGTMLLAAGVYPRFIQAIADVSSLQCFQTQKRSSIIILGTVVLAAFAAIVGFAGPVKSLVVDHRWVMYSLFIGLTLGGVPLVWQLIQNAATTTQDTTTKATTAQDNTTTATSSNTDGDSTSTRFSVWLGAAIGFAAMAALALLQSQSGAGSAASGDQSNWLLMLLAGVAGASAMILPGVSGGYLLLVLGVYVPILTAVDSCKQAVKDGNWQALVDPCLQVVLPVGIGVVVGVVVVSNVLKLLLQKYEQATLGVLLGLLVGAVVGLWPFQQAQMPNEGDMIKGQIVTHQFIETSSQSENTVVIFADSGEFVEAEDWPTAFFKPSGLQIAGSAGLIVTGLALTLLVARIGESKPKRKA